MCEKADGPLAASLETVGSSTSVMRCPAPPWTSAKCGFLGTDFSASACRLVTLLLALMLCGLVTGDADEFGFGVRGGCRGTAAACCLVVIGVPMAG